MTWKHFKREEFACRHCGRNGIKDEFIDKLDALRETCGFPFRITSGYRCPEHNERVSSTGKNGPHTTGQAADIACDGRNAFELIWRAPAYGFTGIGVHQKGASRFIHLDDLEANERRPRPTVWSY